jgi:hypothetical protein
MRELRIMALCGLIMGACSGGSGTGAQSGDLCDRLANPPDKQGTCGPLAVNIKIYDATKCDTAMASCSAADQKALTAIADCYAAVPACEIGKEVTFTSRAFACTTVATVSSSCQMALAAAEKS